MGLVENVRSHDDPASPPRWALPAVLTLSLALALTLAWLPVEFTVGRFIYDDMFYYLKVAEFLAAGAGSTFDGVSPTNGYHPAWMALSTLMAHVFTGEALVHAMLTVAAVLHVGQGALLARILGRMVRPWLGVALVALYLLNWRTLSINLCGLETALATFMALLVTDRLLLRPVPARWGAAFGAGLLLGLAALARFDLLLLGVFTGLAIGLGWWLRDGLAFGRAAARGLAIAGGGLAALLPWFVFSWQVSGALLPNSRHAVRYLTGLRYDPGDAAQVLATLEGQVWSFLWWSSDIANLFGLYPGLAPEGRGMFAAGGLVALLGTLVAARLLLARRTPLAALGLLVLGYAVIHFAYYAIFHRIELRYVLPALALFFIPLAVALELSLRRRAIAGAVRAGLALAFVTASVTGAMAFGQGHASNRAHKYHYVALDMARWLAAERPDTVAGAWNAGILGYASGIELVNLDGVINDDALAAIRAGRIDAFIRERGIVLIVDEPSQIEGNLDRFAGPGWRDWLGPEIHRTEDGAGRRIVAREVRFPG